jgi:hypothetical protein
VCEVQSTNTIAAPAAPSTSLMSCVTAVLTTPSGKQAIHTCRLASLRLLDCL